MNKQNSHLVIGLVVIAATLVAVAAATNFIVTPPSAEIDRQDCMGVINGSPPGTLHPVVPVCPPNGFPDQAPDIVGAPLP